MSGLKRFKILRNESIMKQNQHYDELEKQFPDIVRRNEPLDRHTTLKIGGAADLFCEVHSADTLCPVLKAARSLTIPTVIIGRGSNILVDDEGFRGFIVKYVNDELPRLDFPYVTVSAGNELKNFLEWAIDRSLTGLEFLAGIPGTIGGALYMNAGAYGKTIGEILYKADIVDETFELQSVDPGYFEFRYRKSILQKRPVTVISAVLSIANGIEKDIRLEYQRILAIRAQKHPRPAIPCAGSYFKNLPPERPGENRRPAGYFLEKAGAKSMKVGDAEVYHKHANIIINSGNASARDILQLAQKMKDAVYEKFNITLEEEVRYLDSKKGMLHATR